MPVLRRAERAQADVPEPNCPSGPEVAPTPAQIHGSPGQLIGSRLLTIGPVAKIPWVSLKLVVLVPVAFVVCTSADAAVRPIVCLWFILRRWVTRRRIGWWRVSRCRIRRRRIGWWWVRRRRIGRRGRGRRARWGRLRRRVALERRIAVRAFLVLAARPPYVGCGRFREDDCQGLALCGCLLEDVSEIRPVLQVPHEAQRHHLAVADRRGVPRSDGGHRGIHCAPYGRICFASADRRDQRDRKNSDRPQSNCVSVLALSHK